MVTQRSHHLRWKEPWAIRQARRRHDELLWLRGEYCAIVLMWRVEDEEAGLVARCSECWTPDPVADAYGQGTSKKCSSCYGSFFEGGYKAIIYRPSIWDVNEESHEEARRGEVVRQAASIQTTSDFQLRRGDYALRADGSRWQVQTISTNHLRTGFGSTTTAGTSLGWNSASTIREDETAPVYLIPPDEETLIERLAVANCERWPRDNSPFEVLNGDVL